MIVKNKVGEYFGLVDPKGFLTEYWDELKGSHVIPVQKFQPILNTITEGRWGSMRFEVVTKKFRRDYLQLTKEPDLVSKQFLNSFFSEEDEMANSNAIIEIAKTGDVAKTEEALQSAIGQAVKRALWVAERNDEFLAIPVLQDLQAKYCGVAAKGDPTITEKDGKIVKLVKGQQVDDRVWQAILKKASKIGAVVKSSGNRAELIIRKKEVDVFVKASKAVAGITVEA